MTALATTYMGIKLRNPLIVASSSLVKSVKNIQEAEKSGAGAVVLKSLFEEQIRSDARKLFDKSDADWHSESYDYLHQMKMDFGQREYLELIKQAKQETSIPVIASINCHTTEGWMDYAQLIEESGADAIELNISVMPANPDLKGRDIEEHYFSILDEVKRLTTIPIAVKIGPYFSSMARMAAELVWRGASGLVLFNRFYQFDIDIHQLQIIGGNSFSHPSETSVPLRWIAILSGNIRCDLSASTGIHTAVEAIKHILAGASTVQLCSTLYRNGISFIGTILDDIESWMKDQSLESIDDFRGLLSRRHSENPEKYERRQYIKALIGIE